MITGKMTFKEVLSKKPKAAEILFEHGLACCSCHMAVDETLEEGCKAHGLDSEDIKKIVKEINSK